MIFGKIKSLPVLALALLLAPDAQAAPAKLSSAWMGEHETFVAWYAKQQGWDKEAGLDLTMMPFDSGKNIVESLAAYDWAVAGCGAVPALTTPLSDYLYIMRSPTTNPPTTPFMCARTAPSLEPRGTNPSYPNVYGSRCDRAKGQYPVSQSIRTHYLLATWLRILGLSEKDVKLQEMEPTPALSAFTGGVGDAVALWAPLTYEAEAKGFKSVANSKDCGITQLVLLVANRRFADQHPEQVQAFLKMYMRGIEALRAKPAKELAVDYVRFYKEWTGRELTPEMAVADIQSHPVFTLDEQLAMFATGGSVQKALNEIVDFSISHGSFTPEQIDKMKGKTQVAARSSKPSSKSPENRVSSPLSGPRREGVSFSAGVSAFHMFLRQTENRDLDHGAGLPYGVGMGLQKENPGGTRHEGIQKYHRNRQGTLQRLRPVRAGLCGRRHCDHRR